MEPEIGDIKKSSGLGDGDKCPPPASKRPGYAPIKAEFLLPDHKPTLNMDYVSSEVKEKLQPENTTDCNESVDESSKGRHAADDDTKEEEPPQKKAKLKGRNKNRPRTERTDTKSRLCPSIKNNRECSYGDKCKFGHDKGEFMKQKQPELEGPCPNYTKFGLCEYSVACRFAKSHLTEELENMKNEELFEKTKCDRAVNILDNDLKHKLWKKKYDFKRSEKSVKDVEVNFRGWGKPDNTLPSSTDQGEAQPVVRTYGQITDEEAFPLRPQEKKKLDFTDKLYLAPLTTVGNLPFRRVCKGYGADITCGEMALCVELLKGKMSEWSLIKRHPCEDIFGVQICGSSPDIMTRCSQLLTDSFNIDFIDINCGCPIDLIFQKGAGSALMGKATKLEQICRSMKGVMGDVPLTVKMRTGVFDNKNVAHTLIPRLRDAGVSLVTVHGRSREQRYTKTANWDYIRQCVATGAPMPVFGNGDVLSYEDANIQRQLSGVNGVMIARGALIKPWIFTEIKEQRHWDISSGERLDMLRNFANYGLEHWGSDNQGVENTRRFLLEWLSFLHRYIPVGVLEVVPQKINQRPPYYVGRNDLETMMGSANCADWIKITEMLLGPVPESFKFLPKHKANAYQ